MIEIQPVVNSPPMRPSRKVKCPTCKKEGDWFETKQGPFCSQRCKLVDLGKWLGQENRISEPLAPEHLKPYAELPPGRHLDHPDGDDDPSC